MPTKMYSETNIQLLDNSDWRFLQSAQGQHKVMSQLRTVDEHVGIPASASHVNKNNVLAQPFWLRPSPNIVNPMAPRAPKTCTDQRAFRVRWIAFERGFSL